MSGHGTAWVCVDCYFAHHYGATQRDGEWFSGESDSPCDREPLAQLANYDVADNTDFRDRRGNRRLLIAELRRLRLNARGIPVPSRDVR